MKRVKIDRHLSLERLLAEAVNEQIILTDETGLPRFALIPAEGDDASLEEEAAKLRSSTQFMSDIERWQADGASSPVKSHEQIQLEYDALGHMPAVLSRISSEQAAEIVQNLGIDPKTYGLETGKELLDYWSQCVADLAGDSAAAVTTSTPPATPR
jgi:hypothetical protein